MSSEGKSILIFQVDFQTGFSKIFWKVKVLFILNLFLSKYTGKIPPYEYMKDTFSVRLHTKNLCLC